MEASPVSFKVLAQNLELQGGEQGGSSGGQGLVYTGDSATTGLQSGEWTLSLAPTGQDLPPTPASGGLGVPGVKIGEIHISPPAMSTESGQCTDSARPDQSDPQQPDKGDEEEEV